MNRMTKRELQFTLSLTNGLVFAMCGAGLMYFGSNGTTPAPVALMVSLMAGFFGFYGFISQFGPKEKPDEPRERIHTEPQIYNLKNE